MERNIENINSNTDSNFCSFLFHLALIRTRRSNRKRKQEFRDSCSICHGTSAKGDGVFATMLTIPVADLTTLNEKYGNKFPFFEVYLTIDGRDQIKSHELMNMPMWGQRFSHVFSSSVDQKYTDTLVRGKIFEIMLYLQSIQE